MEEQIKFEYRLIDIVGNDHEQYKTLHNSLFKGAATSSEWILWYQRRQSAPLQERGAQEEFS